MVLSMRSAQSSEEWSQHAKISIPRVEIELTTLRRHNEVSRVTFFSDTESTHGTMPAVKFSTIGTFEV